MYLRSLFAAQFDSSLCTEHATNHTTGNGSYLTAALPTVPTLLIERTGTSNKRTMSRFYRLLLALVAVATSALPCALCMEREEPKALLPSGSAANRQAEEGTVGGGGREERDVAVEKDQSVTDPYIRMAFRYEMEPGLPPIFAIEEAVVRYYKEPTNSLRLGRLEKIVRIMSENKAYSHSAALTEFESTSDACLNAL